jgi:hypothetical protein
VSSIEAGVKFQNVSCCVGVQRIGGKLSRVFVALRSSRLDFSGHMAGVFPATLVYEEVTFLDVTGNCFRVFLRLYKPTLRGIDFLGRIDVLLVSTRLTFRKLF